MSKDNRGRRGRKPKNEGDTRSKVLTVRLTPRQHYLAELAARKQGRAVSGYIEWAVEQSFALVELDRGGPNLAQAERRTGLWDVYEPDRFAVLAQNFPELLDHEGQVLWKLIRELGSLWKGSWEGKGHPWKWECSTGNLNLQRLRFHWAELKQLASDGGDIPPGLAAPVKRDGTILYPAALTHE